MSASRSEFDESEVKSPGRAGDQPEKHDVTDVALRLSVEHRLETSGLQNAMDRVTALVSRPASVAVVLAAICSWVAVNLLSARPLDPPPLVWLQDVLSGSALLVAALILTTQRREDQLASHRAQMILELCVLNDQKISKVIELIEEGRRDNPALPDRIDGEATAMSSPADTRAVLEAIKDTQSPLE
jgi:uncharacterized membrane protein